MFDFNAHILSGFPDGPSSLQDSSVLLKELMGLGFKKIVCAPRYVPNKSSYISSAEKKQKIKELEVVAKYDGVEMRLYFANEVFLMKNIDDFVQKGEISLLGRNYVLIKLPERGKISLQKVEEELNGLRKKGYVPILAGPEKSVFLQEDEKNIDKLSGTGAMFQCGYGSIIGLNGRGAERLMKYMLERGFVDFLGTEVRRPHEEIILKFDKASKKIKKIIGEKGFEKIMRNMEGVV